MTRPRYYILDAELRVKPIGSVVEWAAWRIANPTSHKQVGSTLVTPDGTVIEWDGKSTRTETDVVFLSLDHNFSIGGPPLLFETMVFGGSLDQDQFRTSTWSQAQTKHKEIVEAVRSIVVDEAKRATTVKKPNKMP